MSWTTLRTYVAGEILTAAILNTDHRDNVSVIKTTLDNSGNFAPPTSALTLASDACTPTQNRHTVDTQAAAASDDLSTLTIAGNVRDGHLLLLSAVNIARVVTVKNGVGNIVLHGGDYALNAADRRILLQLQATTWYEVSRSDYDGSTLTAPELKNFVETFTSPSIVTTSATISSNTLANPTVVTTAAPHGYSTGDIVSITGSNSTPSLNGLQTVTVTGASTFTVPVNVTVAGTAGTVARKQLTLNLATGCEFAVSLNSDITMVTITGVPSATKVATVTIKFTADGTVRAITWPASFGWGSAVAPVMTGTNGKVDIVTARTYNGGTAYYPALYTQNA